MTTFDRFDPFERRIGAAMDDIVGSRSLDYLDDVFLRTARSSQRPRWSFPERWFIVDATFGRLTTVRRFPLRPLVVLAVLLGLVAASAVYVGTQKHLPAPFGPAANGQLAYVADGDIYVRDTIAGVGRPLVTLEGDQIAPTFSPDGTRLAYATSTSVGDRWFIANADGSAPVEIALVPATGNAQGAWAPDSLHLAMIYDVLGAPQLRLMDVTGRTTIVELGGGRQPLELAWMPPSGQRLLLRTEDGQGRNDLMTVLADGTDLRAFGWDRTSAFGVEFTLSGALWSPDGKTIAYNGVDSVTGPAGEAIPHFRIHVVAPDGTNDRALPGPADPYIQENWPTYSPDGRWIAVHRWQFKEAVAGAQGWLAVMPADGSQVASDIGPRFDGGEDTGIVKTWSPDSSRILMLARSTNEVYAIDPVSGESERLPWTNELPDWQRVAP